MGQVNKATAAILAGAAVTLLSSLLGTYAGFNMTQELNGALQTLLTALIVYLAPANKV